MQSFTQHRRGSIRVRSLLIAAAPIVAGLVAGSAQAADIYWNTTAGTAGVGSGAGTSGAPINWVAATSTKYYWSTVSATSGTPAAWAGSTADTHFDQDPTAVGSSFLSVDGAVNPNSLQFSTGENYTFTAATPTATNAITLGNGTSNGGIYFNHASTYVFNVSLKATQQVVLSSDPGKATVNFGSNNLNTLASVLNSFTGGIKIASPMRLNLNYTGADGSGGVVNGNTITISSPDAILVNSNSLTNAAITNYSRLLLNSDNVDPYDPSTHPYGFITSIGATTFTTTSNTGYIDWRGQITGNAGIMIGNDTYYKGGGNALTILSNSTNNYTGDTIVGSTGGAIVGGQVSGTANVGSLRLGADNAIPTTSNLIFGLPNVAKVWGNLDLHGQNDTLNSISTPYANSTSIAMGITNSGVAASTLTIQSTTDTSAIVRVFDSPIGAAAGNKGTLSGTTQLASDNLGIVYDSPATLQLGAANTYTGGTTIKQGVIALKDTTVQLGTAGSLSPNGFLKFTGAGTLDLAGQNQQVTGLSSTGVYGTVTNSDSSPVLFTANIAAATTNTFSGAITNGSSSVSFTKSGPGTLVMAGTSHAYTGNTTIGAGTLQVDGSLPAGTAVTVSPNAILAGKGTINGSVNVQTGAIVAPGGHAALTVNSLTVQPGADFQFNLGGTPDSISIVNNLSFLGGNPSAVEIGSAGLSAGTYHLMTYGGSLTGGVANLRLYPLSAGFAGLLQKTGNNIDLVVTQVTPETWTGSVSGAWNTSTTNFTPSLYTDGTQVVFDDSGSNTGAVNIATTVSPTSISFLNSTKAYVVGGGAIAGNSSITVSGGGSVTLSGANTFSGAILLSNGTLNVSADNNLGNSGNDVVISTTTTSGTLAVATGFSSGRQLTLHGTANVSVASGQTFTVNGPIDGGGSLTLTGLGEVVLANAANAYFGSTTISAGKLTANVANVIPSTSNVSVASGATLNLGASQSVGSIAGAGSFILGSGAVLTSNAGAASTTISGPITGTGTLTKNGSGTLTLSSASNTFGGSGQVINVAGGNLSIAADANLGNTANSLALASGTGILTTGNWTTNRQVSVATGTAGATINAASGTIATLNGAILGPGSLNLTGLGTTLLNNAGNSISGLTVSGGTATAASGAALGSGTINLLNQATLNLPAGSSTDGLAIGSFGTTIGVASGDFNLSGAISGTQNTGITKTGTGRLIVSGPASSVYNGAWEITAGTVDINTSTSGATALGNGGTTGGLLPSNSIHPKAGTLQIDNVALGQYSVNTLAPRIYLDKAGSILGTGANASYGYDGGGIYVYKGTSAAPITMALKTSVATDVLTIGNEILQYDSTAANAGDTYATIGVSGLGKVLLQGGRDKGTDTFAGSWAISAGILQLGPVVGNPAPTATNTRPFGEPLNALGFKNGDPDQPNPVTLTGGVLAVGVDSPNTNPGWTASGAGQPANSVPNYLRNGVILSGGSIASTGIKTVYDAANALNPQGVPDPSGAFVVAQFGGDFATTASTTSKVLTYDPSNTTQKMDAQLVGGSRTLTNPSNGSTNLTYKTTWAGTLVIDPGTTTGGSFSILRDAGTIAVTTGAQIQVKPGAILNLGGLLDSTSVDGTSAKSVAIQNGNTTAVATTAQFNVQPGTHNIAALSGDGVTTVASGATLIADSLRQVGGLTLNGVATVRTLNAAHTTTTTNAAVSVLGGLTMGTGSQLNLGNNDLIVRGGNFAAISAAVIRGYNGVAPAGQAGVITSAAGSSDIAARMTLAVIPNTDSAVPTPAAIRTTMDNQTGLNTSDVLLKYTYYGDSNLDGVVSGADYTRIDAGYGSGGTKTGWVNGDFNYDGHIDGSDYSLIDGSFGAALSALPANSVAAPASLIAAPASSIAGPVAVPEPTTMGLLALGATALLGRRLRKSK